MPWCPKCKTEYKSGMTTCIDCGSDLVEQLTPEKKYTTLCTLVSEEFTKKLTEYLSYSSINSYYEYDEKDLGFVTYVLEDEIKEAKKAFIAFYSVEAENYKEDEEANVDSDDEDSMEESMLEQSEETDNKEELSSSDDKMSQMIYDGGAYEKKNEKAKELKSTAFTFLAFGIAGLIFVLLNIIGVLNFIGGPIAVVAMPLLFVGFILVGINSFQRMQKANKEAAVEEKNSKEIMQYLDSVVTEANLKEWKDDSLSEEANFLRIMDCFKDLVLKEFDIKDEAYLDYITEEFYNSHFS